MGEEEMKKIQRRVEIERENWAEKGEIYRQFNFKRHSSSNSNSNSKINSKFRRKIQILQWRHRIATLNAEFTNRRKKKEEKEKKKRKFLQFHLFSNPPSARKKKNNLQKKYRKVKGIIVLRHCPPSSAGSLISPWCWDSSF